MIQTLPFISLPINEIREGNLKKDEMTSNTDKETNFSYNENTDNSNNIIKKNFKQQKDSIKYEIKQIKKYPKPINLLTQKPIYNIPIDKIIGKINMNENSLKANNEDNNYLLIDNKEKITKNEKSKKIIKYEYKPNFIIPIEKIKEELNTKNKINELNEKNNNLINNNIIKQNKNEDKNKNIKNNSNIYINLNNNNKINNNLYFAEPQKRNINQMTNLNGFLNINNYNYNSNFNDSKYLNNNYNNYIMLKIIEQKAQFKILKDMGIRALTNKQNINHYLLKNDINNNNNNTNINK